MWISHLTSQHSEGEEGDLKFKSNTSYKDRVSRPQTKSKSELVRYTDRMAAIGGFPKGADTQLHFRNGLYQEKEP